MAKELKGRLRQPTADAGEDAGLSLESFTAGFAQLMSTAEDPYAPAPERTPDAIGTASELSVEPPPEITPRLILEAMLFVGHPENKPLTSQRVASLMRGVNPAEIDELVRDLNEQYARNACPYTIASQGAGYRLVLRAEYNGVLDRLTGRMRETRLSQAAIEVLALVAYNESITGDEIAKVRGHASGAILSQLVRRQLLSLERPADGPRPVRYRTTGRFLKLFGLESLADLPRTQEIDQR